MRAIEPYVLHAALQADEDEVEGVYHLRPLVEVELPDDAVTTLEEMARAHGCDLEVLLNAILAERVGRTG